MDDNFLIMHIKSAVRMYILGSSLATGLGALSDRLFRVSSLLSNYVNLICCPIKPDQFFSWFLLGHVKSAARIYFWVRPAPSRPLPSLWDPFGQTIYLISCPIEPRQFFSWFLLGHVKSAARMYFWVRPATSLVSGIPLVKLSIWSAAPSSPTNFSADFCLDM